MENTGKVFTPSMVEIKKITPKFSMFNTLHRQNYGLYENEAGSSYGGGDVYWIKRDENTYEGVTLELQFPDLASGSHRSYRNDIKANGLRMLYQKKMIITQDGVEIKKCSKQDKKIYTPKDLADTKFHTIKLNVSKFITAEVASDTKRGWKRGKEDMEKYSIKELR
jgi:hypothetical protein